MDVLNRPNSLTRANTPAERRRRRRRPSLSDDYEERWNQTFSIDRKPHDDRPFITDTLPKVGADDLNVFTTCEGPVPSCEFEDIKKFCADAVLPSGQSISAADGHVARAWLDDREKSSGNCRSYPDVLSAAQLYESLAKPRFNLEGTPDADRRLIYIPNLGPEYVLALAKSASYHQFEALRKAIWQYLTLQTSIRVHIPAMGYITFRLEFHLPYYALRRSLKNAEALKKSRIGVNDTRDWIDLSFLRSDIATAATEEVDHGLKIHEAMTSVVLCGTDDSRWIAYAFIDTEFNGVPVPDDDYEDSPELNGVTVPDDDYEDDFDLIEDPIASDRRGPEVDANQPIWNARRYFLRIVDLRMSQILEEWRYIVRVLEESVKDRRKARPINISEGATLNYIREETHCTIRTIEVLRQLRQQTSTTFETWRRFSSPRGDRQYFAKVPGLVSDLVLKHIEQSVQELMDLDARLQYLNESCERVYKTLGLILNFESNRINFESHCLNSQTSVLNHDTHRLTIETKRVALDSHRTARQTSQTAQLTLSMSLIVSSITIVIAYFSTPQAIFHFDRNSKSFILSVLLVSVGVKLINYALILADRHELGSRLKGYIIALWEKRSVGNSTSSV